MITAHDGTTHWPDCWREHRQCAEEHAERLGRQLAERDAENKRLREALDDAANEMADAHADLMRLGDLDAGEDSLAALRRIHAALAGGEGRE